MARLRTTVEVVALTHGKDGCDLFVGDEVIWVAAYPTNEIDLTGAGDTFSAALLRGLASGAAPRDAARVAAAAASLVVEAEGASGLDARLRERVATRSDL